MNLLMKRNDSRMNNNNKLMLVSWRANIDLQIVIDEKRARLYATKYFSKGESSSKYFEKAVSQAVKLNLAKINQKSINEMEEENSIKKLLTSVIMKISGQRDYSTQEVCHLLLSLPMVKSNLVFLRIVFKTYVSFTNL